MTVFFSHFFSLSRFYEDLPKAIMAPAFWFAQTAQLDEHLARETKVSVRISSFCPAKPIEPKHFKSNGPLLAATKCPFSLIRSRFSSLTCPDCSAIANDWLVFGHRRIWPWIHSAIGRIDCHRHKIVERLQHYGGRAGQRREFGPYDRVDGQHGHGQYTNNANMIPSPDPVRIRQTRFTECV